MNCPNCGEQPKSVKKVFSRNRLDFKKKMMGNFLCVSCGVELHQLKNSYGLPSYERSYWYFLGGGVLVILLIYKLWFIFLDAISGSITNYFVFLFSLVIPAFLFIPLGEWLRSKYMVLELAKDEPEEASQKIISKTSILLFFIYAVAAIFGFTVLFTAEFWDNYDRVLYLAGNTSYVLIVLILAMLIMKKNTPQMDD